jgi:homeobox protein cut-like
VESERLSRALEAQKQAASDAELTGQKKMEELSRDIQTRVWIFEEVARSTDMAFHFPLLQSMEIDQLKQRLKQYGDYDEIKRELEIMKVSLKIPRHKLNQLTIWQYVEFAGLDEDADEDGDHGDESGLQLPNPNAQKANAHRGKTLEALLATKNKRILEELTKFRVGTILLF